jgi:hypothetical protein
VFHTWFGLVIGVGRGTLYDKARLARMMADTKSWVAAQQ